MLHSLSELQEAHRALLSTLKKCEKVLESDRLKPAQRPLTRRRVSALGIALSLIKREMQAAESQVQHLNLFMECGQVICHQRILNKEDVILSENIIAPMGRGFLCLR